jgi:hypothetical protein
VNYEEIRYEGYGIGGAAIIVDTMTDNRVRTVAEVRHAFSKHGGNMGTEGSVAFQFKHCAANWCLRPAPSEDKVMEVALEAGADDVITDDDGAIEVLTAPTDFEAVKNALEAAGLERPKWLKSPCARQHHRAGRRRRRPHAKAAGRPRRPGRRAGRLPQRRTVSAVDGMKRAQTANPHESTCHWRRWPRTRQSPGSWPVAQGPQSQVFVAPGNGGTARDAQSGQLAITDVRALRDLGAGKRSA